MIPKVMGDVLGYTIINVTGVAIALPLALAGTAGLMMFAKGYGPRMGHNQYENKQFKNVMKELGIDRSDPRWRIAHDALQGQRPMGYKELLEFIKSILGIY